MLGTESHYMILKNIQFIHLDDLCESHIFLFERPEAKGRYICSSHDTNIYELAEMLKNRYPEYDIPQKLVWIKSL
jgi:bifunctional dihydroflavonol 4-reductase/flavanone 4-reductase